MTPTAPSGSTASASSGDRLEIEPAAEPLEELPRLGEVLAVAQREREGLQARRALAARAQHVLDRQQDGAAVDAAGEEHAEGLAGRHAIEPPRDLAGERADVAPADLVEVGRQAVALRGEEALVGRVRIGTADQPELDDVVRRHHPRVARVKLPGQALGREQVPDRVDALGDDERRPVERPWPGSTAAAGRANGPGGPPRRPGRPARRSPRSPARRPPHRARPAGGLLRGSCSRCGWPRDPSGRRRVRSIGRST